MTIYTPGVNEDLLLLNWYMDLGSGPDFEAAFTAELAPCASFMAAMSKTLLVYEMDERGIWAAMWFDRQMSAGLFGLWLREDVRKSLAGYHFIRDAFTFGLERFPVLIGISRSPAVIDQAVRGFGFVPLGDIPGIFDGETAGVAWVDATRFATAPIHVAPDTLLT